MKSPWKVPLLKFKYIHIFKITSGITSTWTYNSKSFKHTFMTANIIVEPRTVIFQLSFIDFKARNELYTIQSLCTQLK